MDGAQYLTHIDGAPKRSIVNDTAQVVLTLSKEHTAEGVWDMATKKGDVAAREWLKARAQTTALDVRPPTRISGQTNQLRVISAVPKRAGMVSSSVPFTTKIHKPLRTNM